MLSILSENVFSYDTVFSVSGQPDSSRAELIAWDFDVTGLYDKRTRLYRSRRGEYFVEYERTRPGHDLHVVNLTRLDASILYYCLRMRMVEENEAFPNT